MSCTDHRCLAICAALLLAGCASRTPPPPTPPAPQAAPAVVKPPPAPNPANAPQNPVDRPVMLTPPKPNTSFDELRRQAALRLVAANPDRTYMNTVPPVLLAIPVLEIELHRDGRVKQVHVLRRPGQALDTLQMAIDAVHRAAPFGDVSQLKPPHKFTETFLFRDDRRFKPRTLDD